MSFIRTLQVIVFLLFGLASNAHGHSSHIEYPRLEKVNQNHADLSSQTVYVCLGEYAYAYHSRSDCPGLSNCKGSIKYTDESTASVNLARVPCCRCWSNVSDRCKDDNPYYGNSGGSGGDASEAYAIVALAVVATSALILSNDIYFHGVQSFHQYSVPDPQYWSPNYIDKQGYSFGLRKTWPKFALEYGASMITREYTDLNDYKWENELWSGHVNLVRQIFPYSAPTWADYYLGPSLVYNEGYYFGGVCGMKMRLTDRLFFDVRYQLSKNTNHIGAGLIFNYQKKYFWNR